MRSSTGANVDSEPRPASVDPGGLRVRVLSALVLAPVVLVAVWTGGWIFVAVVAAASLIAVHEWIAMLVPRQDGGAQANRGATRAGYAGLAATLVAATTLGALPGLVVALAGGVLVALVAGRGLWIAGVGVPYVGAGAIGLLWLRGSPDAGLSLLLFVLLAVWATDIGAYAAGRAIGGPKLAPRISPKKTWAGLIGGMASAGLVGLAVALAAGAAVPAAAAMAGGLVAIVSQAGDLFESAVKRRCNVKDSGSLIPGHGGVLDRIDGLLAAAPALALFHASFGAGLAWW